jgi:hypothetical protein
MTSEKRHWIIRAGDGENLRNSKNAFWGVKKGAKPKVTKMNHGDILWFLTPKKHGSKIIGMCEYTGFYDRRDEPLLQVHTKTNEEQGWTGDGKWDIQMHYCKFYNTEKQNITGCIQHVDTIFDYEKYKTKINGDLDEHYRNFIFYAEPRIF